ncbi:Arrestin-C domain-containing protein [Mycena kentingensis (nom. inval.)]|nr:Arrestin-C domain-containing protein [Mycena kentingensis (nom. inval.)]
MHLFRSKSSLDDAHDFQRMEVVVDREFLFLQGTGTDSEPALLSGHVALHLKEPTTFRAITLQFRGKAFIAQPPQQDSFSQTNTPTSTYIVCKHEWSFLEGAKKHSYTLKAGRHVFPFKLNIGGSLPSSVVTSAMGGASVAYKLRAIAQRTGLNRDIQAVAPVYIIRSLAPGALEFQQTRDVEHAWMHKLMFYIAIPHTAWAAGDELVALLKITPLVKGVGVLSVTTSLRETTKLYNRQGSTTRTVATVTHEILGGQAVEISEVVDRQRCTPQAGPSRDLEQGEDDVVTTLRIPIPSQLTPTHTLDPIHVSYIVHWSVLLTNADGHISEIFCSFPITILDSYLLKEVRTHTALARHLLIGGPENPPEHQVIDDSAELPSYTAHIRDRIANMFLSEANTLRVTNPWVQMGVSPIIVQGQTPECSRPIEVISDPHSSSPFVGDPANPVFLDWVNAELLISQGATKVAFPPDANSGYSGSGTGTPSPDHPPTPPTPSVDGIPTYTHTSAPTHNPAPTPGIFVANLEPTSSFSHPAWLSARPDPKEARHLSPAALSSAETVQRRVLEVSQPKPNVNSELLHRAFTEVPDYEVALRGFLGGVPPLSSMQGLPSYSDSQQASRSGTPSV